MVGKFKRRKWIVNYQLQGTITFYSVIMFILGMSTSWITEAHFFREEIDLHGLISIPGYFALAFPFLAALILIMFGFQITNRIAGPMFHMRKHIDEIVSGKTKRPLKVRKGDFFQDLIDSYNRLLKFVLVANDQQPPTEKKKPE